MPGARPISALAAWRGFALGRERKHERSRGMGWDYLHVVIDDHSRPAYVELHGREDAQTNARTLERAIAWFSELGLGAPRR